MCSQDYLPGFFARADLLGCVPMAKETVGERIDRLACERGIPKAELARYSETDLSHLRRALREDPVGLGAEKLALVGKRLGVSLEFLFFGHEESGKPVSPSLEIRKLPPHDERALELYRRLKSKDVEACRRWLALAELAAADPEGLRYLRAIGRGSAEFAPRTPDTTDTTRRSAGSRRQVVKRARPGT